MIPPRSVRDEVRPHEQLPVAALDRYAADTVAELGNARTETSWSLVEDLCAVRQRLCNFRAGLCHGQFALRKGVRRLGGIVRMPRQVMAQAMHVRVPAALERLELGWAASTLDDTQHGCARAS